MYEHILVPLDGSDLAEAAVPYAEEIARAFGSKVALFQVIRSLDSIIAETLPWGSMNPAEHEVPLGVAKTRFESEQQAAEAYLNSIVKQLGDKGVSAEVEVAEGDARDEILSYISKAGISLVVMSSHGRGALGRLVLGSVADTILRRAGIPVLLITPAAIAQGAQ